METATEQNNDKDTAKSDKINLILRDITDDIVKINSYRNHKVNTKFNSLVEQGFLGTICEVNIKGSKENSEEETNLFVKIMNADISTFIILPEIYARELFVYRNLSKIYEDLQNEANVPKEERYKMVKSYSEFPPTVIVLENMKKRGYKTQHRSNIVSLEFAVLAVKQLAKFHALSFVLKQRRPIYFEENITTLKHSLMFNEYWSKYIDNFVGMTMKYVNDNVKKKLEVYKMMFEENYKMYLEEDKFKLCLCHGDFRPCNILMRETNGQTEVIPIDYQLVYYGCPIMDLIYFIFTALDQNMRRNIQYLKDTYYKTMESFLTYFNIKVQDVFPREDFEIMYNERLDFGLQTSLLVIPILMAPDDNITDINTMTSVSHNTDKDCQERMIGIINDFIEWGYL